MAPRVGITSPFSHRSGTPSCLFYTIAFTWPTELSRHYNWIEAVEPNDVGSWPWEKCFLRKQEHESKCQRCSVKIKRVVRGDQSIGRYCCLEPCTQIIAFSLEGPKQGSAGPLPARHQHWCGWLCVSVVWMRITPIDSSVWMFDS